MIWDLLNNLSEGWRFLSRYHRVGGGGEIVTRIVIGFRV